MPDPTSPANDVEAALAAWEAARHRSETQAPYSAAATLRVAGDALAELVARIPTLEAALHDAMQRGIAAFTERDRLRAEVSSLTARIEELNEEVVVAQDWRFKIGQLLESERVARQAAETERDAERRRANGLYEPARQGWVFREALREIAATGITVGRCFEIARAALVGSPPSTEPKPGEVLVGRPTRDGRDTEIQAETSVSSDVPTISPALGSVPSTDRGRAAISAPFEEGGGSGSGQHAAADPPADLRSVHNRYHRGVRGAEPFESCVWCAAFRSSLDAALVVPPNTEAPAASEHEEAIYYAETGQLPEEPQPEETP